jgi:hypothetical protein
MLPSFVKKPLQTWLLWQKAKAVGVLPSFILGLEPGSYVAYCLDEAVIFFGLQLENMLDSAGHKPSKEERKTKAAREAVLDRVFSDGEIKSAGFADPALMFN